VTLLVGQLTRKIVPEMTYNVLGGMLNATSVHPSHTIFDSVLSSNKLNI